AGEAAEPLGLRIEAHDRVAAPFADPDLVVVVDINRIGLWPVAWQLPDLPGLALGVVAGDLAGVPLADPDLAPGVGPHPAGTLLGRRRLEHRSLAACRIDAGDVAARKRGVIDHAVRRAGDAIRSPSLGRVPHLHGSRTRIEPAVDAILAGEP